MSLRTLLALIFALHGVGASIKAGERSSANYTLAPEAIVGGAITNGSGSYSNAAVIDGWVGVDSVGSVQYTVQAGYFNEVGLAFGAQPPQVESQPAVSISATRASLSGHVLNPDGGELVAGFLYGTSNPPTQEIGPESFGAVTETNLGRFATGLMPGTKYYFRLKATNPAGTSLGAVLSFTTNPAPTNDSTPPVVKITAPAAGTVSSAFTLSGTVRENKELASFEVTLNGVPLILTNDPLGPSSAFAPNADVPWSVGDVAPENGANTIVVEAVDSAGKHTVVSKSFSYLNPAMSSQAGTYSALLVPAVLPSIDTAGFVTVTVAATGSFSGKAMLSGVMVPFSGMLKNNGVGRFKPALATNLEVLDRTELDSYLGSLAVSVTADDGLTGTLSTEAGGAVLATFAGKRAPYSAANPVPASFLNQPAGNSPTKGVYTVVFPCKEQAPARDPALYPQGDGFASLTVTGAGAVSLSGYLADGTSYKAAGKLRADGSVAVFNQLYRKQGAFGGELRFEDQADSDVSGTGFLWLRPPAARAQYYPVGWPNGLRLDPVGAKYSSPASFNFGQGAADAVSGNASLVFTDGLLSAERSYAISIDPVTGAVKLVPANATNFKLSLSTATGLLSGTFTHTDGKVTSYRGALLNKGQNHAGFGYFLSTPQTIYGGTGQSGRVVLQP